MKTRSDKPERIAAIDALRVIAILGVVLIHTTTRVLERTGYNLNLYSFTLFLNQAARFSVPLFFLISGFVLELNYKDNLNFWGYIKKRFSKIFIPYVFWSLIYYFFVFGSRENLFYDLLTGNASYQLYFIPTLCIFYLLFPFFHKFYKYLTSPLCLTILSALELYLSYKHYFVMNFVYADPIRISLLAFFFFILGMFLEHLKEDILNLKKIWIWIMAAVSAFLANYIFKEGKFQYYLTWNINGFYTTWRPSVFVYTLSTFAFLTPLLKNINLRKLSNLSFLVFFIHVAILEAIWNLIGKFVNPNFYFDIIFFTLVAGISFGLAFLIHKIPQVSKITG